MIYPQKISGYYRTIKNFSSAGLLLIYFLSSWIRWDRGPGYANQAILLDLTDRRAYLFGVEIWPDELYFLAGILILAALGLFFITSLYGRIWCGYTCPHTVFVELFVKVEAFFQGDRNARMKLDAMPMDSNKLIKKLLTHLTWAFIAFTFAYGWVCYFYDAKTLTYDLFHFQVTSGGLSWLIGLTATTYLFAGFVREKVCLYMCPYGRFQSAMLDNDTSLVMYHGWRGEPRGKLEDDVKKGDCIDCGKCVVVCPMGIDIRNGLQLACIGCGLCVDACNSVMAKIGRPLELIGYDSYNSSTLKSRGLKAFKKIATPKIILFGSIFVIVSMVLIYSLINKDRLKISISHERGAMYVMLPDGTIRNSYTFKLYNKSLQVQQFDLKLTGIDGALMKLQGFEQDYRESHILKIDPDEEIELIVFIKVDKDVLISNKSNINFELKNLQTNKTFISTAPFLSDK